MLVMAGASSYKREVLSPRYQTSCFPPLVEILHQLMSRVLVRPSLRRPQGYIHTFRNRNTRRCSPTACPSLAQLVIPLFSVVSLPFAHRPFKTSILRIGLAIHNHQSKPFLPLHHGFRILLPLFRPRTFFLHSRKILRSTGALL